MDLSYGPIGPFGTLHSAYLWANSKCSSLSPNFSTQKGAVGWIKTIFWSQRPVPSFIEKICWLRNPFQCPVFIYKNVYKIDTNVKKKRGLLLSVKHKNLWTETWGNECTASVVTPTIVCGKVYYNLFVCQ